MGCDVVPAVCHVDGTASKDENKAWYELIRHSRASLEKALY
jgi:predicted NodU family carbamoyl transferase